MRVRSARHKSLCVAAYLLRCGTREWRRLWGRAAAPKSTVIVRENAPARLPSFMNLGTFAGSYAGGCDGLWLWWTIAPAEKGDQS